MSTKVYCDLCKGFITEYGQRYDIDEEAPQLNRPFIISTCYEGKSLDCEEIGWSGPKEKIEFWACESCNKKFMDGVRQLAKELGLKI